MMKMGCHGVSSQQVLGEVVATGEVEKHEILPLEEGGDGLVGCRGGSLGFAAEEEQRHSKVVCCVESRSWPRRGRMISEL